MPAESQRRESRGGTALRGSRWAQEWGARVLMFMRSRSLGPTFTSADRLPRRAACRPAQSPNGTVAIGLRLAPASARPSSMHPLYSPWRPRLGLCRAAGHGRKVYEESHVSAHHQSTLARRLIPLHRFQPAWRGGLLPPVPPVMSLPHTNCSLTFNSQDRTPEPDRYEPNLETTT